MTTPIPEVEVPQAVSIEPQVDPLHVVIKLNINDADLLLQILEITPAHRDSKSHRVIQHTCDLLRATLAVVRE